MVSVQEVYQEPTSYRLALKDAYSDNWKQAMEEEMKALRNNNTWDVVDRPPPQRQIVDSKWVYKLKLKADGSIERYKGRVVGKGFTQVLGHDFDETFAPVARYESLRLLIAIAAWKGWHPQQMDVKSAFLYGILKEEIYMELPEGYREPGKVARLKNCIYGLKQSAREWYECLTTSLQNKGFQPTNFDPCIFIHHTEQVFLSVYVDDIMIFGAATEFVKELKLRLGKDFEYKDMGNAQFILGLQIQTISNDIVIG